LFELFTTSTVSVLLILWDKSRRGDKGARTLTFPLLLAWAIALPILMPWMLNWHTPAGPLCVATAVLILIVAFLNILIAKRLHWDIGKVYELRNMVRTDSWRALALMVIVAPICEEFIFRGCIFQLVLFLGVVPAIALSSIAFVGAHRDAASAPYLAVAGVLFGALTAATGSLSSAIAAHALANLIAYVAMRLARNSPVPSLVDLSKNQSGRLAPR
jgi:membrane protease YdiL (CAAX protease family)